MALKSNTSKSNGHFSHIVDPRITLRNLITLDVQYHNTRIQFPHAPQWTKVLQWTLTCGNALGLHPHCTDVAVMNMSRSVQATGHIPRSQSDLQLMAVTHLWTASKVCGPIAISLEDALEILTRDGMLIEPADLCSNERRELAILKWKVCGLTTPREFVDAMMAAHGMPLDDPAADVARILTDILSTSAQFMFEPRFHIAATCIYRALLLTWPEEAETFCCAFPCAKEPTRLKVLATFCRCVCQAPPKEKASWFSYISPGVVELLTSRPNKGAQ